MAFTGGAFLFAFLPVVLAAYHLVPSMRAKNAGLLVASLAFYAWGEPLLVLLLVADALLAWAFGRAISRADSERRASVLLATGIALLLAPLVLFKYAGSLLPEPFSGMPLGLSFYALQAMTYLADVRSGATEPEDDPFYVALYLSFFPQLVMGPIVRHPDVRSQLRERTVTLSGFVAGLRLFVVGLAKKVLLSDVMAALGDHLTSYGPEAAGVMGGWAAVFCFAFQLYFDFSGYSDMALGLASMFGFRLRRNFAYPYVSCSTGEFWRRWHISLGSFFRDYVYIPMGGSRVEGPVLVRNLAVVWLLTGMWHGGTLAFVAWGAYCFALLMAERLLGDRLEVVPRLLRRLGTFVLLALGMLAFWLGDLPSVGSWLAALAGAHGATGIRTFWQLDIWAYWLPILACVVGSTPVVPWLRSRLVAWACDEVPEPVAEVPSRSDDLGVQQCDLDAWRAHVAEAAPAGRARVVGVAFALVDVAVVLLLVLSVASLMLSVFHPSLYTRF